MSELELHITVRGTPNLGEMVRRMVIDGVNSGENLVLASDGYTLNVVKLERTDGLPLSIEEDFSDWFSKSGISSLYRDCAHTSYLAGRMAE